MNRFSSISISISEFRRVTTNPPPYHSRLHLDPNLVGAIGIFIGAALVVAVVSAQLATRVFKIAKSSSLKWTISLFQSISMSNCISVGIPVLESIYGPAYVHFQVCASRLIAAIHNRSTCALLSAAAPRVFLAPARGLEHGEPRIKARSCSDVLVSPVRLCKRKPWAG